MNRILKKRTLAPNVTEYVIEAPEVARHAAAGQFVILRVTEDGERVPFTICDMNKTDGTVTVLVQEVGYTTRRLKQVPVGGTIADFVGPLGNATDLSAYRNIVLVGGGIGTAVIYPQAKHLKAIGNAADVIVGARNKELLMYQPELSDAARSLHLITDDGSNGKKGFVTNVLKELIPEKKYDCVFAVGPMPMMRAVSELTRGYGIKTVISMNSIMVDGTGMCGGCRITVGGECKYACVHGPEFDGHLVDWEEAMNRSKVFKEYEQAHTCLLTGEEK